MFGFGPAYADLLRPEDALRRDREKEQMNMHTFYTNEPETSPDSTALQVPSSRELKKLSLTPLSQIPEVRIALAEEESDPQSQSHTAEPQNLAQRLQTQRQNTEESVNSSGTNYDVRQEWKDIFKRLDEADGAHDGLIDRKALVKWVSTLDFQKTIEFETNLNISPWHLERLVSKADNNKDGYVDQEEFLNLVQNRDKDLSRKQQSVLHQYLQVVAYAEEYSCCPPRLFVIGVTVIQISIYLFHVHHFLTHPDHVYARITWSGPEPVCSQLIYNPWRRHEAWRYVSYCLVHAGIQHILFNMIMQLFVGLPLELSHGSIRVAIVYFSGVIAGSLATSSLDPAVFLAGASGGVYALIAAHLATLILNWHEDILIMRRRFRSGRAPSAKHGHITRLLRLITVLIYGAVDTGIAVYNRHIRKNSPVKTSYVAHLAGAAAGLLIGILVLKNRRVEHWETMLRTICVVIFIVLLLAAILWNILGNNIFVFATGTNTTYFEQSYPNDSFENCHKI